MFFMKFNKKTAVYAASISMLTVTGCTLQQMVKMAKNQQLTVTPSPLEVHADTVSFESSFTLPVKMLKKKKTYAASFTYKYGQQKLDLGEMEFKAADFPNAKKEEPKLVKKFSFAYNENLKKGDLVGMGSASNASKSKTKQTPEFPMAKGLITTSRLVRDLYYSIVADHGYDGREELVPTNLQFFFKKGSSVLDKAEMESTNGKDFQAFVAKKNVTRTVTITGTHSPEGLEATNDTLAKGRANRIEGYYRTMMGKNNYSKGSQDSIRFVQKTVVKDWQMFKDTLNADTKLTVDEKKEILAVVNGSIVDFLEKEKELQKLKSYKYLSTKVYPRLRNARTEVFSVKLKKTDSQMAILAKAIVEGRASQDTLTSEELAYAATLTPDLKEKEGIYLAATKKSGNWQSYNNLGAIYLEMARKQYDQTKMSEFADKAITQLLLSVKQKETGHAYANLASAYMMKSNKAQCTESATKAAALSQDEDIRKGVNSLRAVWEIKEGKYDKAVSSLQNGKSDDAMVKFDLALALLLKKDYEKAKVAFDDATTANDKNGLAWYGAAITAARLKDGDRLGNRLQKAIAVDGNLRAKALEDLEFMNYWNTDAFKAAVK